MPIAKVALYAPPATGLPYLSVVIHSDGSVQGFAFDTVAEAEEFMNETSRGLADLVAKSQVSN
jgi:hypothetical protein